MTNQHTKLNYQIGFSNLNTENNLDDLNILGEIPSWINGSLIFTGPAKFAIEQNKVNHWFDGLAMIHAFIFKNGTVSYKNRYLNSSTYQKSISTGKFCYPGFAQNSYNSLIKRIINNFIPQKGDSCYIGNSASVFCNIKKNYITVTNKNFPISFNSETLELEGPLTYTFDKIKNSYEILYPHYDTKTEELISIYVKFDTEKIYEVYKISTKTLTKTVICSIKAQYISYIRSFALTENFIILTLFPLVEDQKIFSSGSFIQNFNWKPELGTKFIIINRCSGAIEFETITAPFFSLNHINAFEKNGKIILDMIIYEDASIIDSWYLEKLLDKNVDLPNGILTRFTILIDKKMVFKMVFNEIISNQPMEFATINYNYESADYNYIYSIEFNPHISKRTYNFIFKTNVKNYKIKKWFQAHCFPSKPLFIQKNNNLTEDNGVLFSIVLDTSKQKSFLLLLDSLSFNEICRIELPHHIPFGTDGIFIADKEE